MVEGVDCGEKVELGRGGVDAEMALRPHLWQRGGESGAEGWEAEEREEVRAERRGW